MTTPLPSKDTKIAVRSKLWLIVNSIDWKTAKQKGGERPHLRTENTN